MRKVRIEEAIGQALCHDMTAILESGFKGVLFSRGHVIREEDLSKLRDIGKYHVYVWEEEADEMHEEDCALALTEAILKQCDWVESSEVKEGKIALSTKKAGIVHIDEVLLKQINLIPDWTVCTVAQDQPLDVGEVFCALRIVPLVTKKAYVQQAVDLVNKAGKEGRSLFQLHAFQPKEVGIVITGEEIYSGRIQDAFFPILREKCGRFPCTVHGPIFCPDDEMQIEQAVAEFTQRGCDLILLTGGMSVDPDDVTPTAIRNTGAEGITQGVPMQPGNMLTIARRERKGKWQYLVGVPGASMHAPRTSLDIVLPRLFADLDIEQDDIASWGLGGLSWQGNFQRPSLAPNEAEKSFWAQRGAQKYKKNAVSAAPVDKEQDSLYRAYVITVSDRSARGEREDLGGPLVKELLHEAGYTIAGAAVVPDEVEAIQQAVKEAVSAKIPLIITTGGTGFAPRDRTPEALLPLLDKTCPGLSEAMRAAGREETPHAMLSRELCGIVDQSLILALPGGLKAIRCDWKAVQAAVGHGLATLLQAKGHEDHEHREHHRHHGHKHHAQ